MGNGVRPGDGVRTGDAGRGPLAGSVLQMWLLEPGSKPCATPQGLKGTPNTSATRIRWLLAVL